MRKGQFTTVGAGFSRPWPGPPEGGPYICAEAGADDAREAGHYAVEAIDHMEEHFVVTCPYCGEDVEIYVEPDVRGTFVQDCEVCCNPWRVRVFRSDGERSVDIGRADGSE